MRTALCFAMALAIGIAAPSGHASAQQPVTFATAAPGSIYNSAGSAIAKLVSSETDLKTTVQAFGGSSQYQAPVNAGELEFGLANVFEVSLAIPGKQIFEGKPHPNLRAVAILFPLRNALFVRKDSPINSVAELKGKRGPTGFTSQKILVPVVNSVLGTAGLSLDDVQGVNVANIVANADAFAAGRTDFFAFALGAGKVKEVDAAVGGVKVVPIPNTPEALAGLRKHIPVAYLRAEKPNPAATGVIEPTYQVAYDAVLFASTKTPDDVVRKVVEAMHKNGKELRAATGPLRLYDEKRMSAEIPGVEYHPAAVEFYKKNGLWPPKGS